MQNPQPNTPNLYAAGIVEPSRSAVSWGAVIAGAVIAAAVSAMLAAWGAGLGFLSISPWSNEGVSGSELAVGSIVWLFATQIVAYGIGGYIAGRLRTKWTDVASDEIYFRDTAHGFLVWALSAVIGAVVLGSAIASIVSGTAKAGATLAGAGVGAATAVVDKAAQNASPVSLDYFTDVLLRPNEPAASNRSGDVRQETSRILARSLASGKLSDTDEAYLVKLIAQRAGVDQDVARQRLMQIEDQAQQAAQQARQKAQEAADAARKAAAAFSLWAFASLLIGAFTASFCATMGGRTRDR